MNNNINNNMNANMNNNINNNMNNDYRNVVFNYIGGTTVGGSTRITTINGRTTSVKSKHIFNITGKAGSFVYTFLFLFIFFSFVFAFAVNNIVIKNMFENVDKNNFLYILLKPMGLFDIKFFIFVLVILFVIYKRKMLYKKLEPKGSSINIYSRELPSKLRPAHMRVLLNDGLIDEVSLGSTIVDLIDKGYLEYYKGIDENDKLIFFHNEYSKLIKTNKPHDKLLKYEKFLIDWFINEYGNGVEVTAREVNNGLKYKIINQNMEATDMFYEWQALVLMSFPIDKYFIKVKSPKKNKLYPIIGIIGMMSIMTFIGPLLLIYGFGMLMLANPERVLNKVGVDEICEWLSLKKFLVDFGDMQNKTAEMVAIWDFYLTYSIALNVSQKASDEINRFFNDNIFVGILGDQQINDIDQTPIELGFTGTVQNSLLDNNKDNIFFDKLKLEIEEEYKKL